MFQNDYNNTTFIHPLGLCMLLVLGLATITLPRRFALVPLLIMAAFVSPAQRITIVSLDWNVIRLMIAVGWIRLLLRVEMRSFRWQALDTLFVLWALFGTLIPVTKWGSSVLVTQLGFNVAERLMPYLLARFLLRSWEDIAVLIRASAVIAMISAVFYMVELRTGRNMFSVFGGVHAVTVIREGRLRCQGPFSHPIIGGVYWASWLPLIAGLWFWSCKDRRLVMGGLVAVSLIVFSSASSTPVFAIAAAGLGFAMYPLRAQMRVVRWGVLIVLCILHLCMNAPVWHLIGRVSAVGGSTGYHRYRLIDNFIKRFSEWALNGTSTAGWGFLQHDVTNNYVVQGISGGIVLLVLFLVKIAIAFLTVGQCRQLVNSDKGKAWLTWAMGVCLFTHCMAFIGVAYFGQTMYLWPLHLALTAVMWEAALRERQEMPVERIAAPTLLEKDPTIVCTKQH